MSSRVALDEVMIAGKVSLLLEKVRALRVEIGTLETDLEALLPEAASATGTDELTGGNVAATDSDEALDHDLPLASAVARNSFKIEEETECVIEPQTGNSPALIDETPIDELPTPLHNELIDGNIATEAGNLSRLACDPQRDGQLNFEVDCVPDMKKSTFADISDDIEKDASAPAKEPNENAPLKPAWAPTAEALPLTRQDREDNPQARHVIESFTQRAPIVLGTPVSQKKQKCRRYVGRIAIAASMAIVVGAALSLKRETFTPLLHAISEEQCLTNVGSSMTSCAQDWFAKTNTALADRRALQRPIQ